MKIKANGITIELEDSGGHGVPVLLVMGMGMQLIAWPDDWVQGLVAAGYRVLRFDNRDIGLSQHFDTLGNPSMPWTALKHQLRWPIKPPYTLQDMALDTLGVLDALGIAQAHVVGVSMGGMIAQRVAHTAPQRVLGLTSIMSSSGAPGLPGPQPKLLLSLMGRPMGLGETAFLAHYERLFRLIGSPAYPTDPALLRERLLRGLRRGYHPEGNMRQMTAVAADTARVHLLASVRSPTLVLHGKQDPLVPYVCGVDTAQRIPGARMVGIEGMGHDLSSGVVHALLPHLLPFLAAHSPAVVNH
jgi:pimeloyl-ACP methyl ester carboxylesterase